MGTFRWLVVVCVVTGAIVGGVELAFALFLPPFSFASNAGASGTPPASQMYGQIPSPLMILVVETVSLATALLSGVMYGVSGRRAWQIALWVAAITLLLPSALTAFSIVFGPLFLPAAILMFLAALFSLGIRETTRDIDVERQPLIQPTSTPAPRHPRRIILGTAVALLGGAAAFFLFSVSWGVALAALAASSVGATLLLRTPLSAVAVPAAVWCSIVVANIVYGAANARLADPIFWGGMLEFGAILIVIAVIPALVGVALGALLTRWIPGASA
jgi:hypothetical protein